MLHEMILLLRKYYPSIAISKLFFKVGLSEVIPIIMSRSMHVAKGDFRT